MTEKTSPCLYCHYLSEEKDACMFYHHMDVPLVEPELFIMDEFQEAQPEYPDSCLPLDETKDMLEEHLGNVDELLHEADVTLAEVRDAWMRVALARHWIETLEQEVSSR